MPVPRSRLRGPGVETVFAPRFAARWMQAPLPCACSILTHRPASLRQILGPIAAFSAPHAFWMNCNHVGLTHHFLRTHRFSGTRRRIKITSCVRCCAPRISAFNQQFCAIWGGACYGSENAHVAWFLPRAWALLVRYCHAYRVF